MFFIMALNTINHKPKHPFGKQNICLYSHILSVWFIVRMRVLVTRNTSHLTSNINQSYKTPYNRGEKQGASSTWTGFDLTTIVMTGTDCTGTCKSNYHTKKDSKHNVQKGTAICIFMYNKHCILCTLGTELLPSFGNGIPRNLYTTLCQGND
jgi:hypothetical protein